MRKPRAWVQRLADRAARLLERYGPVRRVMRHVTALEAFDFSLVLAAQAFLTIVPLLIVLAAFAPRLLGVQLSDQLQAALGLSSSSLAFRDMLGPPGHAARVGGVLGFVLLVAAGASTATALQRGYERVWGLKRLGLLRSAWRSAAWLAVTVLTFGLSGFADATFKRAPGRTGILLALAFAGAMLFWWWTPHLLLGGRVRWRVLSPSAVLTGGVLVGSLRISPLLMPGFVTSGQSEFGPLGTVFVVMLWLTIVCSIVVFCAIAGQVLATEPKLARLLRPPGSAGGPQPPSGPAGGEGPSAASAAAAPAGGPPGPDAGGL